TRPACAPGAEQLGSATPDQRGRNDMPASRFIYKVASAESVAAAAAAGRFVGMPVDAADGYIHFSTAGQLPQTLALHFAGQAGVVLLAVEAAALGKALRWEPSRAGELFPHLYAALPMSAVR